MVTNLPAMQETQVQSLGWEDPLEKGMATHSSILAWRIQWTEELGGLQSIGSQRVRHNLVTNTLISQLCSMERRCTTRNFALRRKGKEWSVPPSYKLF